MDGSIAASASLRMRDQLRGAFHAPAAGAGLFEELLRMPVTDSRSESDADAPSAEDEALVQAAAPKASSKPSGESHDEADDDADSGKEAGDQANVTNAQDTPLVQVLPPPVVAADPPPPKAPSGEKIAAPVASIPEQSKPVVAKTAPRTEPSQAAPEVPAAMLDEPSAAAEPAPEPTVAAESGETVQAVETTTQAPTEPSLDAPVAASEDALVPVAASLESDAKQADQTPHPSAEVNRSAKVPSEPQGISAVAPAASSAPANSAVDSRPEERTETSPETLTQTQPSGTPAEQTVQRPAARGDDDGRREKWFLNDDEPSRAGDSEPGAAGANQDRSPFDALASTVEASQAANVPTTDALPAPGDAAAAELAQPSATTDAAALAATLAQQSTSNRTDAPRGDSRASSHSGVSQVGGGRPATAATSQTAGGKASAADKGGVAGLSQQERVRLVQRVARSFSRLGPDGGQVTLKLHPPQLGVLNMSVRIEGQTMTARLQTETSSARDTILENLPVLRERLAEQGIEVESFQVEVAGDRSPGSDSQSQSPTQNPYGGDSAGDSRSGPRSVDFRRLSRNNTGLQPINAGAMHGLESTRWSPHSPLERTLDIRA